MNSQIVHVTDEIVIEIIHIINKAVETGGMPVSCLETDYSGYREHIINELEKKSRRFDIAEIDEALDEIKLLISEGSLYTGDVYKEQLDNINNRESFLKAMCIHIAHDCNLACRYCFAEEGMYHGKESSMMSFETGKAALDLLVEKSGSRINLEVDFFGGEPLMNFDVVRQLVEYGRSIEKEKNKRFRFTLTTNAILLNDEITDFLNREMSNVVLSLDGRKEVNDRMRVTKNGKGSYDLTVPKIQDFVKKRGNRDHYIRGTFTKNNLDFTNDILDYLRLGFKNLSLEPVVTGEEYGISEDDLPRIMEEYEKLAALYLEKEEAGEPFTFFHFMIDLDQGPCVIKRLSGCGSGTEYVSVTPDGNIYPCHQFAGQDEFLIGNVNEGITNTEIPEQFKRASIYTRDKCEKCFARFFCSGGCPANSYNFSGDINKVYEIGCEMQRKRVECAIMIKAAISEREENE